MLGFTIACIAQFDEGAKRATILVHGIFSGSFDQAANGKIDLVRINLDAVAMTANSLGSQRACA